MATGRELVERARDCYNSGDLDGLLDCYKPDAVSTLRVGTFTGQAARDEFERGQLTAFPDRRIEQTYVIIEQGHLVAAEYTWTGTHTGPFSMPDGTVVPPTGEHSTIPAVSVFELRDGRVATERVYYDNLPAMLQAGVVKPEQQPIGSG